MNNSNVSGIEYNMFNEQYATRRILQECDPGTTIAFYLKTSGGTPIARSFGVWDGNKID